MRQPKIHYRMLYFPAGHDPGADAWAAIVTFVHSERKVNLAIFDPNGALFPRGRGIILAQDGDPTPPATVPYCVFAR